MTSAKTESDARGVLYALGGFGIWGVFPVYFLAAKPVGAAELVAHRVIWSALLLAGWLASRGRLAGLLRELRSARRAGFYLLTALLISANWLIYVWATQNGRVLDASLGYYINPLANVLLGVLVLRERLNRVQWFAVALAAAGVTNLVVSLGVLPWISLSLAFSFGTYTLLRKIANVDPMRGLAAETLLLAPLALAMLAWWAWQGELGFLRHGWAKDVLLIAAGPVTVIPLLLYLEATRRLRLATLGLLQYLTPTLQFLLAVVAYGEPFGQAHALTFACIWLALALYSADTLVRAART
jgi:chloramphenicol-sensitive protein RarD